MEGKENTKTSLAVPPTKFNAITEDRRVIYCPLEIVVTILQTRFAFCDEPLGTGANGPAVGLTSMEYSIGWFGIKLSGSWQGTPWEKFDGFLEENEVLPLNKVYPLKRNSALPARKRISYPVAIGVIAIIVGGAVTIGVFE